MSFARVELPTTLLILFALVACAGKPAGEAKASNDATATPENDHVATTPAKASEDSPPSGSDTCGDVACQSSSDCCKGYACGFDPERSHVQRYCLGQ